MPSKIGFRFHQARKLDFDKSSMDRVLLELFQREGKILKYLNIIFTSDTYLLGMNQQYLKHDTLTDIITFSYHAVGSAINGELYISVDRVEENAGIHSVSFEDELSRVVIHGSLHLCGYSDHTPQLKAQMTKKEDYYLSLKCST